MPPHGTYVEPFLGGGALMRLKRPAALNIGVDLDPDPIAGYLLGAAFAGSVVAGTAGTAGCGEQSGHARSLDSHAWADAQGLHWRFQRGCGIEYLELGSPFPADTLIYCDPPYLHSTRASRSRYACEMTDLEHRRLLRVLRSLKCHVMISGYSSALYAKELKGWNATAFQAATRGAPAAEWVWYNFDRPVRLHDYRFLGGDFRERERIRRQQKRWSTKLKAMPLLQRQALLSVLADI